MTDAPSHALLEALARADRRTRELERLRRLAGVLLSCTDIDELQREVVSAAAELLDARGAALALLVEEGRFLRLAAAWGHLAPYVGVLVPTDRSLLGLVVSREEAMMVADMAHDERSWHVAGEAGLPSPTSGAMIPLRSGGLVIGALGVYDRTDGRPFSAEDLRLLETLGDQVVVGLDRAAMLEESRRNEQMLAAKNRELQRATQLKSEFLANMSHELRTPLNSIIGFTELILTGAAGDVPEMQRDFLESVLRNGRHLLGLINAILDLSKIEAGRMTLALAVTDLREALRGAVTDTASLRAARRQACEVELPDDDPLSIVADGTRVRQVLFNLLSNASKFTPEDGTITVTAVRARAPLPIPADRVSDRAAGVTSRLLARDAVWVAVRDTGIGIQTGDMDKLFKEFSQVESAHNRREQGTGLGLALCRQFVELHGGTIGAESVAGVGSSFWFFLPVEGPLRRPGTGGVRSAGPETGVADGGGAARA